MKNMDPLNECVATLLNQSTDKFTADLWRDSKCNWVYPNVIMLTAINVNVEFLHAVDGNVIGNTTYQKSMFLVGPRLKHLRHFQQLGADSVPEFNIFLHTFLPSVH